MLKPKSKQSGFTLIEMVFYLLFIAFVIGGALGIIHHLLRNNESLKSGISIEEEGNFVLKKISWVLNDTSAINSPASLNSTAGTLSVNKNGFTNPVVVSLNSGVIRVARGGNSPKQLSNDRFTVTNLTFQRTWDGAGTEYIKTKFFINGREFTLIRNIRDGN